MKNDFKYTSNNNRSQVLEFLKENNFSRVLDVGYSANNWSSEYTTHYMDINESDLSKKWFEGDINVPYIWENVQKEVDKNGKFDFCICTHTLEDIINPHYVCCMMEKYSKAGFIATPSKYVEMSRHVDMGYPYRGYIHHRYIFNKENNEYVAYPKLSFVEQDNRFDRLSSDLQENNAEIQFFWEDKINLIIKNNNYMGPTVDHVLRYYNDLLQN